MQSQRKSFHLDPCRLYHTVPGGDIALPSTESSRIAKELLTLFSRVGIPEEILSDKGANFMGKLQQEIYELLHIKHIQTSPYHPQMDGLVARRMVWWSDSMVHQRACYGSL